MDKQLLEIYKLIKRGISLKELSEKLNLSYREITKYLYILEKKGYTVNRKYYYNGDILYSILSNLEYDSFNEMDLISSPSDTELEFMVISDLHLGSTYETPQLINLIYDYCIKKGIHYLLNLGDLVDGVVNVNNNRIPWYKQINHALRVYPLDKEITSFLLLGNHDYSLLQNFGQNIMQIIKERREDIVPIGYGEGIINVKNDIIVLQHPLLSKDFQKGIYNKAVILRGHGHESKIYTDNSNLIVYAPSLSKLNFNRSSFPGAVYIKLIMRNGKIENVEVEELVIINKKIYITNSMNIYIGCHKNYKNKEIIRNEEDYKVLRKV